MRIGVLGPVEVEVEGARLDTGPAKQQCVLAVLALEVDRVVPVDALVDRLWENGPPAQARNVVQTYVARLRKTLTRAGVDGAGAFRFGSGGYRLAIAHEQVDLFRFRALAARAQREPDAKRSAELLRAAVGLWRGDALAGIEGGWASRTRDGLAQQLVDVRRRLVEIELRLGRHAEMIGELTELAATSPLDEALAGLRMLALYRSGRPADALEVFREVRQRLVDELGDEPGAELRALHEKILRRDPAIDAPAPEPGPAVAGWSGRNDLPAEPADFTGRAAELKWITETAESGSDKVMVLAVDGMAGAGKTAVTLRAARQLAGRCPDAQLYLDLRGHSPGLVPLPPEDALDALLRAVGVGAGAIPDGLAARAAAWRARIAGRRVLLILDDAAAADQVRPLLPGAPGSVVIVTSRTRLVGLTGAQVLSLPALPAGDAADLFDRIVGPAAAAEPDAVDAVVRICGRLPLAITLAAARMRHRPAWTVTDLLRRLEDRTRRLRELRAGDVTVAAAFETSYRDLAEDARGIFRRLGLLFGPNVEVDAAAAVAGVGPADAEALLEHLVDVHLLEQPAGDRYRMHDLLRQFAIEAVEGEEPAADRERAVDRLLGHYVAAAEEADGAVRGDGRGDGARAAAWLDRNLPDLLAAAATAAQRGDDGHACRIAFGLYEHLENRSRYGEGEALFGAALVAARRSGDRRAEAVALRWLGVMQWRLGRFDSGEKHLEAALDSSRALADPAGEALALYHLGGLAVQAGRAGEAIGRYEAALRLQRPLGDDRRLGNSLNNLGVAYSAAGRRDAAARSLEEALERRRRCRDVRGELATVGNLAVVRLAGGDAPGARTALRAVVSLARTAGDRRAEIAAQVDLGIVELRLGDAAAAGTHFEQAIALVRELGDERDEVTTRIEVGRAHLSAGDPAEAQRQFRIALDLAESAGARYEAAHVHAALGEAAAAGDRTAQARTHGYRALAEFEALGAPQAADVARWLDGLPPPAGQPDQPE